MPVISSHHLKCHTIRQSGPIFTQSQSLRAFGQRMFSSSAVVSQLVPEGQTACHASFELLAR